MTFSVGHFLAAFLGTPLLGRPVALIWYWDLSILGKYGNIQVIFMCIRNTNLIVHLAMIILPLLMLWQLQTPIEKMYVTFIFFIGLLYVSVVA